MTVLTDQLQIAYKQGKQDAKNELKIATDSRGGNQWDDMSGYGSDWPGTMKDQMDEPGTDPAEVFEQLELPLDTVERLGELMIAGDPSFTVGGSKGSSRNKKIMSSGDANAPNAKEFMEKLQLGPAMFPVKKAGYGLGDGLKIAQNLNTHDRSDPGRDRRTPWERGGISQEEFNNLPKKWKEHLTVQYDDEDKPSHLYGNK